MNDILEIVRLANGDVVLVEADSTTDETDEVSDESINKVAQQPLLRISFSDEVQDMLGDDVFEVAEAMIEAATEFLDDQSEFGDEATEEPGGGAKRDSLPHIVH